MSELRVMFSSEPTTQAIATYLRWHERRFGEKPKCLRLSRRTIVQLCAENNLPSGNPFYKIFEVPIEQIPDA